MPGRTLSTAAGLIRTAVFADLQTRIDRLTAAGQKLIPLQIGDTCLPPPEAARRVLADLDPEDPELHRYGQTGGLASLREALAAILAPHGRTVNPGTEVLVGNGGTHALYCAARAVLDAGDEVVVATPYWPLAPGVFQACGAVPVFARLTQRLYEDAAADPTRTFAAALTPRTKAIYYISPNNPDGKVLSASQLERIDAFAKEHDLWVFADEVYAEIVYPPTATPAPSITTVGHRDPRTITLHSLSKSHALAGLRVGFVVAPPEVVAAGRRVSTHTAFNVSLAMQRAALAALSDTAFPRTASGVYRTARDRVAEALAGAPIRFHLAEGATYLFLDFAPAIALAPPPVAGSGEKRPLYAILERAVDRGVLLAPGDAFGADYSTFARLCFTAAPLDDVLGGVERLRDALMAYIEGRP
jgi:aspartate/methionine/tyrosine aminotransferase